MKNPSQVDIVRGYVKQRIAEPPAPGPKLTTEERQRRLDAIAVGRTPGGSVDRSSVPVKDGGMTANTYTATYGGKTATRKSAKPYTHASVVQWSDGESEIVSFHTSEAAALKGVLTAQQKRNGAQVVAAVPVKDENAIGTEVAKPKSKLPYTVDSKLRELYIHEQIIAQVGPPPPHPGHGMRSEEWAKEFLPVRQAWEKTYREAWQAHPDTTSTFGHPRGVSFAGSAGAKAVERGYVTPYAYDGPPQTLTAEGRAHVESTTPTPPPVKAAPATGTVAGTLDRPRTGTYTGDIPANPKERRNHKPLYDHVVGLTLAVNTGGEANALGYALNDEPVQSGDEVMVETFGMLRRGIVTRVGTKNVRVAYATPSGGYLQETEAPANTVLRKVGEPSARALAAARQDAMRVAAKAPGYVQTEEERAAIARRAELAEATRAKLKEERAAADKARREESNRQWMASKFDTIRRRVADGGSLEEAAEWAMSGTIDRGIAELAREVGINPPAGWQRTMKTALKVAIAEKVMGRTVTDLRFWSTDELRAEARRRVGGSVSVSGRTRGELMGLIEMNAPRAGRSPGGR